MAISSTDALSPLDGRYAGKLGAVRHLFSEAGLMRERVRVECAWCLALAAGPAATALAKLPRAARDFLAALSKDPAAADVAAIKQIEARTNHDVKAVEIWLRTELKARGAAAADLEWLHFACTSEDINNLAYALMLKSARATLLLPMIDSIGGLLDSLAHRHAATPMLARTHGQTATPTTVGKELANIAARLERQRAGIERVGILGKMNGAVGNFNAHVAALPQVDWAGFSRNFVESLSLASNAYTTQIEPHDWIAEYCHALMRANTVLLDLARDMWSYISLGYFKQRPVEGEVGSSTMPHKVNPIDFENAEGNLGLANALFEHLSAKLPISRLQRDLTDSTVLRNIGVPLAHSFLALKSIERGMDKLELNRDAMDLDLENNWAVVAEAIQTILRKEGYRNPYEALKTFTRVNEKITKQTITSFIDQLKVSDKVKKKLKEITPFNYTGV